MHKPEARRATRGPWTCAPWEPGTEFAITGPGEDEWIADVVACSVIDAEAREANARLIAAAPELRDALRDLAKVTRAISDWAHTGAKVPMEEWSRLYAELNSARALLARLDGEA